MRRLKSIFIIATTLFAVGSFTGAVFTSTSQVENNQFSTSEWASSTVTTSPTVSPTVTPSSSEIIITEFMANPSKVNNSVGEWFEIYNASGSTVNFKGWRYRDSGVGNWAYIGIDISVDAGNYFVFGKSLNQSENGGTPVDYRVVSSFNLNNDTDEIILEKPDGAGGYITVDQITYNNSDFILTEGISNMLKDLTSDNSQGVNWQQSTIPYGDGDLGTPGGINV